MLKKFVLGGVAALVLAACGNEGGSAAQSAASAPATAAEGSLLARIDNKGTVTVGTEGTYAPFTYHDESGKLTGYDVEVTRAVADKLGVKVDFKETQWDAMLAGLKAGRFDIVANQVSLTTPERLEDELYRPVQRAYGRGKRAHAQFAERTGSPAATFDLPDAGVASQGAKAFVERAVVAAANADRALSELQDTMLPIEFGDADLRAGLAEMRELLAPLPVAAREFLRTLGR